MKNFGNWFPGVRKKSDHPGVCAVGLLKGAQLRRSEHRALLEIWTPPLLNVTVATFASHVCFRRPNGKFHQGGLGMSTFWL